MEKKQKGLESLDDNKHKLKKQAPMNLNHLVEHLTVEDIEFLHTLGDKKRSQYMQSGFFHKDDTSIFGTKLKEENKETCEAIRTEMNEWRASGEKRELNAPPKWFINMQKAWNSSNTIY